jgi:hypothetical protein
MCFVGISEVSFSLLFKGHDWEMVIERILEFERRMQKIQVVNTQVLFLSVSVRRVPAPSFPGQHLPHRLASIKVFPTRDRLWTSIQGARLNRSANSRIVIASTPNTIDTSIAPSPAPTIITQDVVISLSRHEEDLANI